MNLSDIMETGPLLSLPKELRLQIYQSYFSLHRDPIQVGWPAGPPWDLSLKQYHPNLLSVCRLIRHEALPSLYKAHPVILVLRYREGRAQVRRWIEHVASQEKIARYLRYVTVQYFHIPHRSTSVAVDMKELKMMNREQWLHPTTQEPLRMLGHVEEILSRAKGEERHTEVLRPAIGNVLESLVNTMTAPLQDSRLLRCESLANARLHGYTDFQLRFEVIRILYNSPYVLIAMDS